MTKKQQHKETLIDTQLERAFLASLFVNAYATEAMRKVQGMVLEDDFTTDQDRDTWRVMRRCADMGRELSPLNIYAVGKDMGIEVDVRRYTTSDSIFADSETLGKAVHAVGQRRRYANQVEDAYITLLYDPDTTTEQVMAQLEKATKDITATSEQNCETFGDVYHELLKVTQDKANGLVPEGVRSGFNLIDRKGGLERGELMIIAGRNSNGKTSLALCIALNAALSGEAVGIFSLEMTNLQLTTRLTSLLTGINGESLKRADMTQDEWGKLVAVDDTAPIYFDKHRSTQADALIANIKGMVAQQGVSVVVIDYLQLLRGKERERIQQIGGVAHQLEALSKQLGICIILLSQLRRNQPNDPVPRLEELKESGDIADAADSVYLVYRPERHGKDFRYPDMSQTWSNITTEGTALLMCCKHRQGAMNGEEMLAFDASTTRFYEQDNFKPADALDKVTTYNTPF